MRQRILRAVRIQHRSSSSGGAFFQSIERLNAEVAKLRQSIGFDDKEREYKVLAAKALEDGAWKQQQRLSELHNTVDDMTRLENTLRETKELYELAQTEDDQDMKAQCSTSLEVFEAVVRQKRLKSLLSGPNDDSSCFMQVVAGAGGVESRDWVSMLGRMYLSWAQDYNDEGISASIVDSESSASGGESASAASSEGGPRSLTLKFSGSPAYGLLKAEAGVHRLVRISPFDPQHKRHTSFAQVLIYPNLDGGGTANSRGAIPASDLRLDTFRSSGAGGQSVQKTDSAVRITHLPTGFVVTCQNERSQHQNKATAMSILRSRLWQFEKDRAEREQRDKTIGGEADNSFGGAHIRSYVLQPYTLVKDHRSGWETSDAEGFLKGNSLGDCIFSVLDKLQTKHSK